MFRMCGTGERPTYAKQNVEKLDETQFLTRRKNVLLVIQDGVESWKKKANAHWVPGVIVPRKTNYVSTGKGIMKKNAAGAKRGILQVHAVLRSAGSYRLTKAQQGPKKRLE